MFLLLDLFPRLSKPNRVNKLSHDYGETRYRFKDGLITEFICHPNLDNQL
jgi:hypothetical protein